VHFEPGCDLNQGTFACSADDKTNASASAEDKTVLTSAEPHLPQQSEAGAAAAAGIRGYATVRVKGEVRRDWR
jgi:hypothetical protein